VRAAFVSIDDPHDFRSWSGTPFHMMRGLRDAGVETISIGPLRRPGRLPMKAVGRVHNLLSTSSYDCDREPYLLVSYARQIRRALRSAGHIDVVITPGSIAVSSLEIDIPVVIWTDATVGLMIDFYYSNLSKRALRNALVAENSAIESAALFVGSSEWAAAGARDVHSSARTAVVPFGANLLGERVPDPDLRSKMNDPTKRVLLVGVDWERKGVDLAIAAVARMRDAGVDARLDVVGCVPPPVVRLPDFVSIYGFLSRGVPAQRALLDDLFTAASLFMLPSVAECFGAVLCEAAAYGVPAIVSKVGGTESAVLDGQTGRVLETRTAASFAAAALAALDDDGAYEAMAHAARQDYLERLNWNSATNRLVSEVSALGVRATAS